MVISSVKRLQHIYVYIHIYMHVMLIPLKSTVHTVLRHTHAHICHLILCSFIHPFILTLINLLGIWLRMLPLGQVKAEYTFFWENKLQENALTSTPFLSFPLSFFILVFFSLSAVPIIPLKWVPRCACIRRQYADTRPYSCIMYSRCIENVSSEIGCVPRCQGITSTLNFNKF